jgi:hypothetical protein
MRLGLVAGILLAAVARAAGQDPDTAFAPTLPAGVGDVSRWEVVAGDFETARMRGSYRFYVNPARLAMYQLMRYRVELLGHPEDNEPRRPSGERVAFVRNPGTPEPILIWARNATGAGPEWRPIAAHTDEYKVEVAVLMGVLAVHRAARAGGSP